MNTLKSLVNIPKRNLLAEAKKAAFALGGAGLVTWLVQNWPLIEVGLGLAL